MLNFNDWSAVQLKEDEQQTNSSDNNSGAQQPTVNDQPKDGPKAQWEKLINDHRVHFTNKFAESSLTEADRQFVVEFFNHYKYSSQKTAGHIFETKIRGVTFQIAFFKKQRWAGCLITSKTREVTEIFTVSEMKIQTLFELFDKAIKQQSFKDILPVSTK